MRSPTPTALATRRSILRGTLGLGIAAAASRFAARPAEAAAAGPLAPAVAPFDLDLAELGVEHAAPAPARAAPAPSAPPAPPSPARSVARLAARLVGAPYAWGGTSPSGFDCSGFVWYVYREAGLALPRDLGGQYQSGPRLRRADLRAGDLVFFANTFEAGLSHVGIYLGGGRFAHAQNYGVGVTVTDLANAYWAAHFCAANRPV